MQQASLWDQNDPLKAYKEHFYLQEGTLYFDGNSLGLCAKEAEEAILEALEVWKTEGINIWNVKEGKYFLYPSYLAKALSGLIGAKAHEVTVANSATINIHQALATFYRPSPERYKIVVDALNFPSDIHAVKSHLRLHGYSEEQALIEVQSRDGRFLETADIVAAFSEEVAVVLLPAVLYRSAQLLDMDTITQAAHDKGIVIGWDLCHSIGAIDHDFSRTQPDFAIWCNYKYLSGGPGAIGGMYVNEKHLDKPVGLAGWQGGEKRTMFQMSHTYTPSPDADMFLVGTPPILAMAGLEGTLKLYSAAGMPAIREKSLAMTRFLMDRIEAEMPDAGFCFGNPSEDQARGGHVALEHAQAYQICQALKARNVIPDFREPNVIRLAPIALYTSFQDVEELVQRLKQIMVNKEFELFSQERSLVV